MGWYDRHLLPRLIDLGCRAPPVEAQRRRVVPRARGRVLEIGLGSGLNLRHYDPRQVEFVWGLEPSAGMRERAAQAIAATAVPVRWLELEAERIPLEDGSVDTIVMTYTLCTIPGAVAALGQMRRVLRAGGELLFSEHGQAPDPSVQRWQDRVNPLWKVIGGGCHVNRPIARLIEEGGFRFTALEQGYLPQTPRFVGYNYWGAATAR
jgi:ubiquinone/menaquinone biosynthesis C-methylase UbiE